MTREKKKSWSFEEYLYNFKNICDELIMIKKKKKPISNQYNVFHRINV